MKNKKYVFVSAFLLLATLLVYNPFVGLSSLLGTQVANPYLPFTGTLDPVNYWQFSGNDIVSQQLPSAGSTSFASGNYPWGNGQTPSWTVGTGGLVGNYIDLSGPGNTAANLTPTISGPNPGWAVEFLFKPGRTFNGGDVFSLGSNFLLKFTTPAGGDPQGGRPKWQIQAGSNVYDIWLGDSVGRKSLSYFTDDNWHHFVVQYDPNSSSKKIQFWIDGQLAEGYYFPGTVSASGLVMFGSGKLDEYTQCKCQLDQIALYNQPLHPNLIVEHYLNANAGISYQNTAPTPHDDTTDPVTSSLDPLDFMAGTDINSSSPQTPGVTTSVINQLKSYPAPRYKPANTLIRNMSVWLALDYMAGKGSSSISGGFTSNSTATGNKAKEINKELVDKWNYMIALGGSGDLVTPIMNSLANEVAYHNIPAHTITLRAQIYGACGGGGNTPCLKYQGFNSNHYLQNGSGQFLDDNGAVTTGSKKWRPIPTYLGDYNPDGQAVKSSLQSLINSLPARKAAHPTKTIDYINENGEIFPIYYTGANTIVNNDPAVLAAKNASGLDSATYLGNQFYQNEKNFRDQIKTASGLENSIFTEYAIDGVDAPPATWRYKYSEARKINDQINGQYYAMPDFYVRWADNWRYWQSAWHGWQWIVNSRNTEIALGDNLYAPFVSAGWAAVEQQNVRPAQWLGLLKALSMTGAEFQVPGVFNLGSPFPYPENWAWQASTPSYAQGVLSYYENILRDGKLMAGDTKRWDIPADNAPGFRFFSGNPGHLVVARKENNVDRFAITGMENPWSNLKGQVPEESTADIMFGGQTYPPVGLGIGTPIENLKFKVRRQGSTYIYDKTGPSPVFYQLDAWHESSHPWHWSKDFQFEAEVYDTGTAGRTTTVPAGTPAGDYRNFTTYINPASGSTTYKFEPRDASTNSSKTYYLWYLAKSATGTTATASVKVENLTPQTISTNSTTFTWCKAPAPYTVTANSSRTLTFTGASANFQVDKFLLTENANLNLGTCGPETIPPTVNITSPNDGFSVVGGNTVSITADATDASGIASVEFFVNGSSVDTDLSDPYSTSWDTTGLPSGAYVVTAKATDNVGNQATSSPITINVLTGTFVSFIMPTDGMIIYSGSTYTKQVLTGGPITKVKYYRYDTLSNVTRKCVSTILPNFDCNWSPNGGILNLTVDFILHAEGFDAQGNLVATSPSITVTRMAPPPNRNSGGSSSGRNTNNAPSVPEDTGVIGTESESLNSEAGTNNTEKNSGNPSRSGDAGVIGTESETLDSEAMKNTQEKNLINPAIEPVIEPTIEESTTDSSAESLSR